MTQKQIKDMKKILVIIEDDWNKDLEEIKKNTGATKQWQIREAIQMWITSKKLNK